jgi:GT2 family glycosyltransferase
MTAAIVLNWNGADDTLACVESLSKERDLLVLVVDNASEASDLTQLKAGLSESVTLLESPTNLGFAGGCNLGAGEAQRQSADILLFVNNDARLGAGCVERLVAALDSGWTAVNPVIWNGLPANGRTTFWYEKGQVSIGDFIVADHVPATPEDRAIPVYPSDLATGCVLAIRTKDFFDAGGFDEGLFAYFEDVDLALKLRAKGAKLGVVRDAEAWHRGSASSGGYASPLSLFYLFRNGPILTRRHASPEVYRAYRRKAPLQMLAAAANFAGRETASGAAALRGAWAASRGHRGVAPSPLTPGWLLPIAWANRAAWKLLRPLFRRTPPKGAPDAKPHEAGG